MRLSVVSSLVIRLLLVAAGTGLVLAGWQRLEPETAPTWITDLETRITGTGAAAVKLSRLVSSETGADSPLNPGDAIHIAVAVDAPGDAGPSKGIVDAVRMYADEINAAGGVAGHKVVVDTYDDERSPARAREIAGKIATESSAIAVIGHRVSDTSIAASKLYREHRVPAITPTSTHPAVTRDNVWYFRTVYSDDRIGRYIAYYVQQILRPGLTIVVQGKHEYGRALANVFHASAAELDMNLEGPLLTSTEGETTRDEPVIARVLARLGESKQRAVIFLATYPDEAVALIRAVKEADISNVVFVAPDSFDRPDFVSNFENLGLERRGPGFYTDGFHIATPLIYDTAGRDAGLFRQAYVRRVGHHPDWRAAFAYDAAQAIVLSIERAGITDQAMTVGDVRAAVQQQLAAMDGVDSGFSGIAGPVFFDDQGSATRPAAFGRYEGRQFVSALTQFQTLDRIGHRTRIPDLVTSGQVINIDGHLMKRTDVAFVGVSTERFDNISMEEQSGEIVGQIWFRYDPLHDDRDPTDIQFLNAVGPVELNKTEEHTAATGVVYKRFELKGRFRLDFIGDLRRYQQPIFGISFRHRRLTASDLIYVVDLNGLGLASTAPVGEHVDTLTPRIERLGWRRGDTLLYQDTEWVRTLGDPVHVDAPAGAVAYSVLVAALRLEPIGTILDGLVPAARTHRVLLWSGAVILLTMLAAAIRWRAAIGLTILLVQFLAVGALLWVGERMLMTVRSEAIPSQHFDTVAKVFQSAWWLVPALYLIIALSRYAWPYLERRTGRRVPRMIKVICATLILLLALFGVVAFVYHQPLTSLLATSGLVGLVLGLAAQTNLSNVFSGITLSAERPFAIGDIIELEGHGLTRVTDMTWRSTRLITPDSEEISVPNSAVAEAFVKNYSRADAIKNSVCVRLPPSVDTATASRIISDAIGKSTKISRDHPHGVEYGGVQIHDRRALAEYHAWYYLKDNFGRWPASCDVWEHIWNALTESGISAQLDSIRSRAPEESQPDSPLSPSLEVSQGGPSEARTGRSEESDTAWASRR